MPAVSWIIPILNGMPFLPEALESIRAQTFTDQEVIVWDNGSTDGTLEVLREWIPHRIPGRVITGKPLSLGMSLRALVEESQAEFCGRMDADDVSLPARLERQVAHLREHPQIAVVGTGFYRVDERLQQVLGRPWWPCHFTDILHNLLWVSRLNHPSVLFRREAVLAAGNYRDLSTPEHAYWPEDYDLWMRVFCQNKAESLPDRLLLYRQHEASLSAQEARLRRVVSGRVNAFVANAPALTGITNLVKARALAERRLGCALPTLNRIAAHFTGMDGMPADRRWRTASFQASALALSAPHDLVTRVFVRLISRTTPSLVDRASW